MAIYTNHVIERAKERYGLELSDADLISIFGQITAGKSLLLGRRPHGAERHAVEIQDKSIIVVFSPKCAIVTVEPRAPRDRNHYEPSRVRARRRKNRR